MSSSRLPLPETPAAALQRERKFVLDTASAEAFWTVATAHMGQKEPDPFRHFVRTTYFDTDDLAYYRSSRGPVSRSLRVREYGVASGTGVPVMLEACFVELKQSAGGLRLKSRTPLRPHEVAHHVAKRGGAGMTPRVTTWYRRQALQDADESVRITLDRDIVFCRPLSLQGGGFVAQPLDIVARGPECVVEIKLRGEMPLWLGQSLRGLSETVGFSKFRAGMAAIQRENLESVPLSME